MANAGKFFQALSQNAHDRAEKVRSEQDESRKAEIDIWRKVLEDPAANDAQRGKAVENLNKLYNMKGQKRDSPFQKLAGFMKFVGDKLQGRQQGQQPQASQGQPSQGQPSPQLHPLNAGDSGVTAGKRNFAEKALGKVASGLGSGMEGFSNMVNPRPQSLPPLDASAFPTADQRRESAAADEAAKVGTEMATREPYIERQIRLRGEEAQKTARERAIHAMNSKVKYPGSAIVNALPDQSMKGQVVDANNLPIDPNGLYAPVAGEGMGIEMQGDTPVLSAIRVGTGSAREGEYGQIVIDPKTMQLVEIPIHRKTDVPQPPKQSSPRLDGSTGKTSTATPPNQTTNGHKPSLHSLNGNQKPGSSLPGGARVVGPYVRPQQLNPLQKQATATDEARNSLIGDNPNQEGGLMADLSVYNNPESVDRIMKYLGFIENNLAGESARVNGMGPMAAAEWYFGLPTAVSNLQQQAQQELALNLKPEEQQFVTDYFRVMGTIGGMRASTGMPASRWSFQTLYNELPTPGRVNNAADAKRRIHNLIQETNVVAKRNPLSTTVPIDSDKNVDDEVKELEKKLLKR